MPIGREIQTKYRKNAAFHAVIISNGVFFVGLLFSPKASALPLSCFCFLSTPFFFWGGGAVKLKHG